MKKNRPLLYLGAGVVCAFVVVFAMSRRLSSASATGAKSVDMVEVMVAAQDIGYGELLVLAAPGEKNANVRLVPWPKEFRPQGVLGAEDKKLLAEQKLRAARPMVQYEPILRRRVVPSSQFIPPDMCVEKGPRVPDDDLKSGRFRAGIKVDVMEIVEKKPIEFMRCVPIYAIGRLDQEMAPIKEKDPPPVIWLMIKQSDRAAYVNAFYRGNKLELWRSADQDCGEPVLVGGMSPLEMRTREAQQRLDEGKAFMKAGDLERALEAFQDVMANYADCRSVAAEAALEAGKCRDAMALELCKQAEAAHAAKNYAQALSLLDRVEKEYPGSAAALDRAGKLRPVVEGAQRRAQQQARYVTLLEQTKAAIESGNLPGASQMLAELEQFGAAGFAPEGDSPSPAEAIARYGEQLRQAEGRYKLEKDIFEYHIRQGDVARAREKLLQIEEKYPAHPGLKDLQRALEAAAAAAASSGRPGAERAGE